MRFTLIKLAVVAALAAANLSTACAQVHRAPQFTLTPASPLNSDVIHLHVDTGQVCEPTNLVPGDGIETQVTGSQIDIVLRASRCPNPSPPGIYYNFDIDLGPLPIGNYELALWLNSPPTRPPEFALLGTQAIPVGPSAPSSLPDPIATPTLTVHGLGALICAVAFLFWFGVRRGRRV